MTPSDMTIAKGCIQHPGVLIPNSEKRMIKNDVLQSTVDKLQSEKEVLINTICDLRQLLNRLSVEHAKEAESHLSSLKAYSYKAKKIQCALKAAEEHAGHFDDLKYFWDDIVNNHTHE